MPRVIDLSAYEKLEVIEICIPMIVGFEEDIYEEDDESGWDAGDALSDGGKSRDDEEERPEMYPHYSQEQVVEFVAMLPKTLRHLKLHDCTTAVFDLMSALFSSEGVPKGLKRVELIFRRGSVIEPHNKPGAHWEELALESGVVLRRVAKERRVPY